LGLQSQPEAGRGRRAPTRLPFEVLCRALPPLFYGLLHGGLRASPRASEPAGGWGWTTLAGLSGVGGGRRTGYLLRCFCRALPLLFYGLLNGGLRGSPRAGDNPRPPGPGLHAAGCLSLCGRAGRQQEGLARALGAPLPEPFHGWQAATSGSGLAAGLATPIEAKLVRQ
jgi:hypothetical protein